MQSVLAVSTMIAFIGSLLLFGAGYVQQAIYVILVSMWLGKEFDRK